MELTVREQVLQAIDIVDVVGERVLLARKGREYQGLCPFHDDHRPSLRVSPAKQIFKCFSCGAGGDAIKFVQMINRSEYREALAVLAQRAGISVRVGGTRDARAAADREQLQRVLAWAGRCFERNLHSPAGAGALDYARGRGLSDETIQRFGLGFALDAWDGLIRAAGNRIPVERLEQAGLAARSESGRVYDRFRNRLMFPIRDALGRVVAFGGRTLGDDPAKYLNSPETALFSKSRVLYGLDLARKAIEADRQVVVVEGYTDVVLVHQHGLQNVVGTLGTSLSDAHVRLLEPLAGTVFMCFDSDEAGRLAADRAVAASLGRGLDVRVAMLPAGKDPADFVISSGPGEFKSLLQSALGALEFKWNLTLAGFRTRGETGRREAVQALVAFVADLSAANRIDPIQQGLLVSRIAQLLSLPATTVYDLLHRARRRTGPRVDQQSTETADCSAYDVSTRGLSAGLTTATEELFGLVLTEPSLFEQAEPSLAAASRVCEPWKRLHGVVAALAREQGAYRRADVVDRCQDAELCELVGRSAGRVRGAAGTVDLCEAVCERIREELERASLGRAERQDRDEALRRLMEVARRNQGSLGIGQRGDVPIAPN